MELHYQYGVTENVRRSSDGEIDVDMKQYRTFFQKLVSELGKGLYSRASCLRQLDLI